MIKEYNKTLYKCEKNSVFANILLKIKAYNSNHKGIDKKNTGKYQTSYNTTNMNEIYNKWNTNFDNTYDGKVKDNNYSNFADWNKSSLLLEEEYYKDIPNACNKF